MTTAHWGEMYSKHRAFDAGRVQHFAGLFEQLAIDQGGGANGYDAQRIADAWFLRDVGLGENQARNFYRAVCREMRNQYDVDDGPGHNNHSAGSMPYIVGHFMYESCKYQKGFELCSNPFAMQVVDGWYEVTNCMFDMPACRRDREICLGGCGGNSSQQLQDFMTTATKSELSTRVLGSDRIARGRANCTTHSHTFEVDLFEGIGLQWIEYASRLRVRGGFNAIDPRACSENPAACAAVRKALERDPTLTFVNGRFVPAHSLESPHPPPPPTPPPLFNLYQTPPPPPFPPTPSPPPPWYAHAETCVPVVTAAESDVTTPSDQTERAVCVYIRSVQDERVKAEKCFAPIAPSPPPPPPTPASRLSAINGGLLARRVRQGLGGGQEQEVTEDSMDAYTREAEAQQAKQVEFLQQLSQNNFQLRDALGSVMDRIQGSEGRRLWQRVASHSSHYLQDNILATEAFGNAPLAGVTLAECQSLCEALEGNNGTCLAVAYARANSNPRDLALRQCYLLRGTGGCTPGSFAGAIFARRDSDGCTAPTEADNPMCVQLASTRTDMRVLTFDETVSVCKHGKGRAKVAHPRSMLEAFSYLGYARERGVHAFWSDKPPEGGLMVWSGVDGERLNVTAGERRCVLVATGDTDIHGAMFAQLKPCHARLADGVVCESAEAAPPPPPGGTGLYPPPPPPPPPVAVTASLTWYTRNTITPLTQAICLAGLADHDIYKLCTQFANELSKPTKSGTVSTFMPMCQVIAILLQLRALQPKSCSICLHFHVCFL